MTGKVGGQVFSVHGEGERVILRNEEGERQEVDLVRPAMYDAWHDIVAVAEPAPDQPVAGMHADIHPELVRVRGTLGQMVSDTQVAHHGLHQVFPARFQRESGLVNRGVQHAIELSRLAYAQDVDARRTMLSQVGLLSGRFPSREVFRGGPADES